MFDIIFNPEHLSTAILSLLLIKSALLQILNELALAVLDLLRLLETVNVYVDCKVRC